MLESSQEWQKNLERELRSWFKKNGIMQPLPWAKKLGITVGKWGMIINSHGISDDPTIYAKLYLLTGLSETDPRKIPPRLNVRTAGRPGKGQKRVMAEIERRMTEQEWEGWKVINESDVKALVSSEVPFKKSGLPPKKTAHDIPKSPPSISRPAPRVVDPIADPNLTREEKDVVSALVTGFLFGRRMNSMGQQVQELVNVLGIFGVVPTVPEVREAGAEKEDIRVSIARVAEFFRKLSTLTSEKRDRFVRDNPQLISDLYAAIYPYTRVVEEREDLIRREKELNL